MDTWLAWGVQGVLQVQAWGPQWEGPMRLLTFLGTEEFYLLFVPLLYWCVDAALGLRWGVLLLVGGWLNSVLKLAFHMPRPYWVSSAVRPLSAESSFGFPSGHAQNAATLWGALAAHLRRGWAWGGAMLLAAGIGLSRLYLGVHFPQDVLAGWVIGALVLAVALRLEGPLSRWWQAASPGRRTGGVVATAVALWLLGTLTWLAVRAWPLPETWQTMALATTGEPIAPLNLGSVLVPAAVLLGLGLGLAPRRAPFAAEQGAWWRKVLRYLVGLIGLVALYLGLRAVLPHGDDGMSLLFRLLRYTLVGWWIAGGAPWLFVRLRLAS